jgi:hypothetical protein
MWNYNSDLNNWSKKTDSLVKNDFDFLQQELSSTRYYAKCLSGATYLPVNSLDNLYDVIGPYDLKTWYISILGSQYSNTLIPPKDPFIIDESSSFDYYTRFNSDYGLTLKNLFTPTRLIKDQLKNYIYVDVVTTTQIEDINQSIINFTIDGVRLKEGHRVLVKDQKERITLPISTDPDTFFSGSYSVVANFGATIEYEYFNSDNGIYLYINNQLVRTDDLDSYEKVLRFSVVAKEGESNKQKQFHLNRLLNGYFPDWTLGESMFFSEKKNWILRNRVDYNNLFEINYYDVIKNGTQSYVIDDITYTIPERIISVGEFGVILNHQSGFTMSVSNIINNKYKVNLRSISQTSVYYWICGDDGVLLRVRKHDFDITRIEVDCKCPRNILTTKLNSISFYDDLRGVAVGELGTILITEDGGNKWNRLRISEFDPFNLNKVVYFSPTSFFIGGDAGIFIQFRKNINGWTALRKRVSKFIDDDDEYLLLDNINDLLYTNVDNWNPIFSYSTQSTSTNKELLFIVTDDSKIIIHDINDSIPQFDFIYLDFNRDYDDIINISRRGTSSNFYFTGIDISSGDSGIFEFDLNSFTSIGVGNSYSNTSLSPTFANFTSPLFPNEMFDYNGDELVICGNESVLFTSTYSNPFNFNILDPDFESRLKSKLLFLDYDAGSKLNFFTDFGEYRLPESITFSVPISSGSYIDFSPLTYTSSFSSLTQSEVNWFEYWRDRKMTFEYYNSITPNLGESTKVLISPTFSYSPLSASNSITNITGSASDIINLAPTILDPGHNRYNGVGLTAISDPTSLFDLYLYDYLMIYKVPSTYPVSVGDLIRLESDVLSDNFIVNKIYATVSNTYIYMYSEFNDDIIRQLKGITVSLINLNKFSTLDELEWRFNKHDISYGYEIVNQFGTFELNAKFNNLTSYYNLATNVDVFGTDYQMRYTDGFLKFGYTPTYNLLDYLESINDIGDNTFYADKEYWAMPDYKEIPLNGGGNFEPNNCFIDTNGITFSNSTGNKILFGADFKLEWESIFINTFVDIYLYNNPTYTTPSSVSEKMLVMKKYFDSELNGYVIEFHKRLNFNLNNPLYWIDIVSRRKLSQISEDLQYLNNIGRGLRRKSEVNPASTTLALNGYDYFTYERELNFKIPTDSYAKILLSDSDTKESITAILYVDYKNELAMNITNLDEQITVPISNTGNFSGNLFIFCSEKHGLKTGDGVTLEFNGGTGSSQELNQDYFGFQTVNVINEFNFYVNRPYGNPVLVGNDEGFVRYVKRDPFLNYQPVDLIDLGVDGRGKQSIELTVENTSLSGKVFSLVNVDFNKFRFRLIDGLDIESLSIAYPWILEAEISGATIGELTGQLIWYKGIWECGRWFGGRWISGTWISGDWYGGTWESKNIKDSIISIEIDETSSEMMQSIWLNGRWFEGTWNMGTWVNGRWYGGTWNNGIWYRGIWNDGTWNNGLFSGGIWILGTWNDGIFNTDVEPSYWLNGSWFGGDFENGMWYNGQFEGKNSPSRFGTNAFNSRTATWHSGKFINAEFHSRLNLDDSGLPEVSDVHKYSIWYTGQFFSGEFYGGVAYNMDFKSGTWHGGILEDIQVIGLTGSTSSSNNYFVLNGIFKFNIGDEVTLIDNEEGGTYSIYGSNDTPINYKVLYTEEDMVNKWTKLYVNQSILLDVVPPINTRLRLVSRFRQCNWKSGIWTNGIYENGLWEGGIWYNGIFDSNAIWM